MSVLHIFNGDCAAEAWKKAVCFSEPYLVWREDYLGGPIPVAETPREEFARIRAEFLHTCEPQCSTESLIRFQCGLEETLQAQNADDGIMLWFDECMFDMLILSRILFLLKNSSAELRLCCDNRISGIGTELFRVSWDRFRKLTQETVHLYADAWRAVSGGSVALEQFLQSGLAKVEPVLERALHRYAADHPADGSLGLSERKLLKIIADGTNDFAQIFRAFNASEEQAFMGDTMCERMLESLEKRGSLIRKTAEGKWIITTGAITV